MPKVSIIIPVYNVDRYLEHCLKSALEQTLEDIEVLCIDDGSSDRSPEILDKMKSEDGRICVVHKENTGYGHTMNVGLDMAKGKYIVFLESDDFILPDMCQRMYAICEQQEVEIAKADYIKFFEKNGEICKRYINTTATENYHRIIDKAQQDIMFSSERFTWICMYRKDFLNKYHIRHNETPGASFQDNGFWFQTMMYCKKMYFLDEAFYMYRQDNPNSSINNGSKIYSCADEFSFIRNKIKEYPGEKKKLYILSAIHDFYLHLWYFRCVDKQFMLRLAKILNQEINTYLSNALFDISRLNGLLSKKLLLCLANPEAFCEKIQDEIAFRKDRYDMLNQYDYIILYGAGVYATRIKLYLDNFLMLWDKKFLCGITYPEKKREYFYDMKIQRMEDLKDYGENATVLLCARKGSCYAQDMYNNLTKWGFHHVLYAQDILYDGVWEVVN